MGREGTGMYHTSFGCYPQFYDHGQHSLERKKGRGKKKYNNQKKCAHLHVTIFIITASNFWNCLSLGKKEYLAKYSVSV